MNILLLKGFNNYFNRIVKKYSTLSDYKSNSNSNLDLSSINFNPNDGITTELIIGSVNQQEPGTGSTTVPLKWEFDGTPDYCICYENEGTPSTAVIKFRWFVMEAERTRNGQYRIALKRDVLADYKDEIINSPCFVEKGTITDTSNPLLFNSEGMIFNEIKKQENTIKDETKCAWLVGYLKKNIDSVPITYNSTEISDNQVLDISSMAWKNCITFIEKNGTTTTPSTQFFQLNKYSSRFYFKTTLPVFTWLSPLNPAKEALDFQWSIDNSYRDCALDVWNGDFKGLSKEAMVITSSNSMRGVSENEARQWGNLILDKTIHSSYWVSLRNDAKSKLGSQYSYTVSDEIEQLTKYNGRYIFYNNKYYKLYISLGSEVTRDVYYNGSSLTSGAANNLFNYLAETKVYDNITYTLSRQTTDENINRAKLSFNGLEFSIIAQEEDLTTTVTYTLPATKTSPVGRNICIDAQYDMFCMPINPAMLGINSEMSNEAFPEVYFVDNNTQEAMLDAISDNQLGISTTLCTELGADGSESKIYDLQLLPYCPMDLTITQSDNKYYIHLEDLEEEDYNLITDGNDNTVGIIFFPKKANFSKDVSTILSNKNVEFKTITINDPTFVFSGTFDESNCPIYEYIFEYPVEETYLEVINQNNVHVSPDILINSVISGLEKLNDGRLRVYVSYPWLPNPPDTFTFTGDAISALMHWIMPDDATYLKIADTCDFQRLVSPNYNGMFQFKKSKMIDGVHNINIDCTYKPYQPYIKLNPDFSGLYGQDWNDSTGLICNGDFSIPMITDAFTNYELSNKNYQAIFARSIQNLDVNNQIAKEQQQFQGIVGAITGGFGGAVGGAVAGGKAGPYGAVAGAVIGAGAGTAAGIIGYQKDREWLERAQAETRDYSIDQFNYQLGNIKALPQSMTKSSPLSYNNKIWPILEQYSCTDEEKEVLKNKLKYDGMTIMAIGTLNDYIVNNGYVKGRLIRLSNLVDDFHVADAIYQEVAKGFYEGE
ncbi:MAG: hypothetical protein J6W64_04700 [Bacilli bacterium]|nr:hypothetical protein [Bacilli bacterium]